ncbi:hypothetical protein PYW07_011122 [Mythimna separata]|uniref:protein-tyrosine-phosphatase n=1 Tax=Mythimna separata TaxID=271217 RepID=A0AAD7Y7X1_MYTSE|nr:hypothetical protein PYW07_011122 [Mythimna separata]
MTMGSTVGKYPAALVLYFLCMGLWYPILAQEEEVFDITQPWIGELGKTSNVSCSAIPHTAEITWMFDGKPLKTNARINMTNSTRDSQEKDFPHREFESPKKMITSTLKILNTTTEDAGNYTCVARFGPEKNSSKMAILDLSFDARLVNQTNSPIRKNSTTTVFIKLTCTFEAYKPKEVKWVFRAKDGGNNKNLTGSNCTKIEILDPKTIRSTCEVAIHGTEDNGSYSCELDDHVSSKKVSGTIDILVIAKPQITINNIIPINTTQVYINWTVRAFNSRIKRYYLMYRNAKNNEEGFRHYGVPPTIDPQNTSFVLSGLQNDTTYTFKMQVVTEYGESERDSPESIMNVTTLSKEPIFVPNISINGFSATSVTIGWVPPPAEIAGLIHYYLLEARKKDNLSEILNACHERNDKNLPYMFEHLEPHSTYVFKVRACSYYTNACGAWSEEMEAATLDGVPGVPSNVHVKCSVDYLNLTWSAPIKPNAEIKGYTMEITGNMTYKDRTGSEKYVTWGPLSKFMTNDSTITRINDLPPNTLFTIRLSAMTRTRRRGEENVTSCQTEYAPPDSPPRPRWRKILENSTYMFKMYLPRISERNGPICCYRVYMVRLPSGYGLNKLKNARDLDVIEYKDSLTKLGAYVADVFSHDRFPSDNELVLGDDKVIFNRTLDSKLKQERCRRCLKRPKRVLHEPLHPPPTTTAEPTFLDDGVDMTEDPVLLNLERKSRSSDGMPDFENNPTMANKDDDSDIRVQDGPLDSSFNYTLFVEVISSPNPDEALFSDYTTFLMPAPSPPIPVPSTALEIALQITCAVAAVILLLMIIFCIMQTRRTRKMPAHAQLELHNPITAAIRYWDSIRGRQPLVSTVPPDIPPIPKDELANAYAQRQVDSDYGFQKEFELLQMLPECFPDRTTHASEARENQPKNRYPDIKAYDQTRVKLSQIDSITGSDYINANYVMGYQERKQFICAQGPTDTTVNDFWRMIWEHGLELIVMLTNLEEYSKVKCSKYWPEERASRAFGNITVNHVGEKRYSDYIVRELKITKQPTNSDGQPIVENNGISKRNGDIKEASESSAPTSPREVKEGGESRVVRQYHFLMWKDFAAPEHPHSILKFIKRVNEAWTSMVGRPVVVHCSAGVGRTGTLVALDCLLEQLRATGQVAVFNTVAELRRQRNFLVQSLKQYVFVYRALVEYAHYGDTEISASRLKPAVDKLRNTPDHADKCLMEIEFERMLNSPVAEPLKSCGAGAGEELRARNRSAECLPYDRNRVILAPIPGRDFSTYINASFIEAYDNSEGFIITQDPLPNTIMDFWRMVSEHNVSTIVMLSELGDGKCPRYWDDGTIQYEHISVQYEESESCPYYTRRQFRITNDKSGEVNCVRQLQYQGWPTARGHVPEVTRGLAELADAAAPAQPVVHHAHQGTMLVHCQLGTERSPLFVALCTLIRALRVERRVDVSATARAVRSQRARTIDTFLQYEFLYRAILNYAELHNLLEDS